MPTVSASRRVAGEVRAELGRQGITGRELGRRLGWDSGRVSRLIGPRATREISVDEVTQMAEALRVSPQRFLSVLLPRLDSNQQPSGYPSAQVSGVVVDLVTRERVA